MNDGLYELAPTKAQFGGRPKQRTFSTVPPSFEKPAGVYHNQCEDDEGDGWIHVGCLPGTIRVGSKRTQKSG